MERKVMKTGWKLIAAVMLAMVLVLGGMVWPEMMTAAKAGVVMGTISEESVAFSTTTFTYNGSAQAPTITVKDGQTTLTQNFDYTVTYQRTKDSAGNNVTETARESAPTDAGTYKGIITGKDNYTGTIEKEFTINKATPALNGSLETTTTYGDTIGSVKNWLDTQHPTGVDGSELPGSWFWASTTVQETDPVGDAGTQIYSATFTLSDSTNYNSITKDVTVTVVPKPLSANGVAVSFAQNESFTYDGYEQKPTVTVTDTGATITDNDYTISYQKKTDEGTWTAASATIDAGTYRVCVTGQGNYTGTVEKEFTIRQRMVTAYSENAFAEYNGSEQIGSGTVGFENMLPGQWPTITYNSAKGRIPGTYTGSFEDDFYVTAEGQDVTANYTLGTKRPGTLTIRNRTNKYKITATAKSSTGNTYDGNEKSAKGLEASEFTVEGYKYTVSGLTTSDPVSTDVCNLTNTVSGTAVVKDTYGNDVTDQFTVETADGVLEIGPAAVTITAQDKTLAYNGTAQSWPKYDVDGLAGDDAITAVVTGSLTYPEESPVVNKLESWQFKTGKPKNYTVTTNNGTLTMNYASAAITISAASQEWIYDGTAHSNSEVTITDGALFDGDTLVATATGSVTNVADTKAGNNPIADGYKVMHGDTDVTTNYAITPVAGKLTVTKADATIKIAPEAKALTYTGYAQELMTAGEAEGGTMKYAVTKVNEKPGSEAYTFDNTSIPERTDAGTYYVWYKAAGDADHSDSAPAYVQVTIAAKQEEETGKDTAEKDEADKAAAETVTTLINSLSDASGKEAVAEVRAKYEALTNEQKALVSADTKAKLENAEKAAEVTDAINSLTDASTRADVEAVRAKYDALTEDQKKYVSSETVAKLESAERAVAAAANKPVPGTYQVSNGVYTVTEDGRAIYEKPVKAKSKLKVLDTVNVPTVGGGTTAVPVKEIREKAFSSAKKMTQLTIGKNVEIIGKKACEKCTKLTKVIGGVAVKEIRDGAFASCTELETLPSFDKLVKVGEKAFYKVKELTKFTFGKFVSKIGAKAFYACESLKTLKFKGTCELSVGSKAFDKIHSDAKATIKKAVKKAYTKELKKGKLKIRQIKAK